MGGGAGGCALAAKLSSKLGKGKVIVVDPADVSCYLNLSYAISLISMACYLFRNIIINPCLP